MVTTSPSLLERLRVPADGDAWRRFVELYAPLIDRWARRAGLSESDAADMVQEVLLTLVNKLPTFELDPAGGFRRWLKTVTLNKWRDGLKRRTLPISPNESTSGLADPRTSLAEIESMIDEEYQSYLVTRSLELMRRDFRESTWKAVWEVVVMGRSAKEVSDELSMPIGALYAAKFRVLSRLRQELKGLWD